MCSNKQKIQWNPQANIVIDHALYASLTMYNNIRAWPVLPELTTLDPWTITNQMLALQLKTQTNLASPEQLISLSTWCNCGIRLAWGSEYLHQDNLYYVVKSTGGTSEHYPNHGGNKDGWRPQSSFHIYGSHTHKMDGDHNLFSISMGHTHTSILQLWSQIQLHLFVIMYSVTQQIKWVKYEQAFTLSEMSNM